MIVARFACLALLLAGVPASAQETFTCFYDGYTVELPVEWRRVLATDSRTALDFAISPDLTIVVTDWDPDRDMHLAVLEQADAP